MRSRRVEGVIHFLSSKSNEGNREAGAENKNEQWSSLYVLLRSESHAIREVLLTDVRFSRDACSSTVSISSLRYVEDRGTKKLLVHEPADQS